MVQKDSSGQERRQYIRLDSVCPVQFRLVSLDTKNFLSGWMQGFTNNISKGGICLTINNLSREILTLLESRQAKVSLNIELPLTGNSIPATAHIAWMREADFQTGKYLVGLAYETIDPLDNKKILRYAWTKKLLVPVALFIILALSAGLLINNFKNTDLVNGNKALVERLTKITQDSSLAKQKIKEISKERQEMQLKMYALEFRTQILEQEKSQKGKLSSTTMKKLNHMLMRLAKEKNSLQGQLSVIRDKENAVAGELVRIDKEKANFKQASIEGMHKWLLVHQNPHTGLVMSFEGDNGIENWAFTYDQSLVMQVYTQFSDFENVRKILNFFRNEAKVVDGVFLNAYYANDGNPAEYTVHSGPNIWLGIAIVHYTQRSEDYSYFSLAEDIAQVIMKLQELDPEGGIRGGPTVEWFSTEHNLDAYAFFNMLYQATGKSQYAQARDKVLNWLVKHTYGKDGIPVRRGKGDSTIATDTYAWSIAAIGPAKLQELGMDPDKIMEFAEQNCSVEVSYMRPEGKIVKIRGFDFTPQRHLARGGVVSCEWTAQMILSFEIMADFYHKQNMPGKARVYEYKADAYMSELASMIIYSPSPSGQGGNCLPYASLDNTDTGHGWATPKGSRTGSVAGTAYTIFAYYKYNPLELKQWPQE